MSTKALRSGWHVKSTDTDQQGRSSMVSSKMLIATQFKIRSTNPSDTELVAVPDF